MKIAILHPFLFRFKRGIERYVWSLSQAFSNQAVETHLLTWAWPNPVDWGSMSPEVCIHRVPYSRYGMSNITPPFYLHWLQRERVDWVMCFFADYGNATTLHLLKNFRQQSYCLVFHFPQELVPQRYTQFERSGLAKDADCLVGVNPHISRSVIERFDKPCQTIPNGVDIIMFHPSFALRRVQRDQMGIQAHAPVLISLAALEARKGIQYVIRALPYLITEYPDISYWILGEGPYRPDLEAEVRTLHLADHVRFFGAVDDVVPYLGAADIGCLLSYGEAFPIALLEYMAMELPVLASVHDPFPELVRPEWGIMLPEEDAEAVANAIRQLLNDVGLRRGLGQAGRQQVVKNYGWNKIADRYLALLEANRRNKTEM